MGGKKGIVAMIAKTAEVNSTYGQGKKKDFLSDINLMMVSKCQNQTKEEDELVNLFHGRSSHTKYI